MVHERYHEHEFPVLNNSGGGIVIQSLNADYTIGIMDARRYLFTPVGDNRNVAIPAADPSRVGDSFVITNAGDTYNVVVTGVATVMPGYSAEIWSDGTANRVLRLSRDAGNTVPQNNFVELDDVYTTNSSVMIDLGNLSIDLTLTKSARIWGCLTIMCSSSGAGTDCTGAWAVRVDDTDSTEVQRYLSGTNDNGSVSWQYRSAVLAPGTYATKGRMRRVNGTKLVGVDAAYLYAMVVAP